MQDKTVVHKANHGTLDERHAQGNHISHIGVKN